LGLSGARVVKVESLERPDGARRGPPGFFDLLHGGHETVALPFRSPHGRDALRSLLAAADVVIEASRPRALEQLGVDAHTYVDRGTVWVSITAYGRTVPARDRVGFGDDVGIAAGLYAGTPEAPRFCGDAIADPITGLYAAVATLVALNRGGGRFVDIPMAAVARAAWTRDRTPECLAVQRGTEWLLDGIPVAPPRARIPAAAAAPFGAHTESIMAEIGVRRWA
jgi:crotonobetainyl-CoA:carnitine CoA-transferase CaiB-like acyl-CoA transferase